MWSTRALCRPAKVDVRKYRPYSFLAFALGLEILRLLEQSVATAIESSLEPVGIQSSSSSNGLELNTECCIFEC
jgi:hypothetical protein